MTVHGIPALERMELHNFDTGEYKPCLSNPAEIEETISPIWTKKQPVGRSSARLQYGGTDNRGIGFELYFDADKVQDDAWTGIVRESLGGPALGAGGRSPEAIMDWRRFLLSFAYPVQRDDGLIDEPPDAVFVWPGFMSFRAKVDNIAFRFRRWVGGGEINIYTARLRLLSVGDVLVTSQDARTEGPGRIEFIFG